MFCGKCGSKIDDKLKFCPNCGASVSQLAFDNIPVALEPTDINTEKQVLEIPLYSGFANNTVTATNVKPEPQKIKDKSELTLKRIRRLALVGPVSVITSLILEYLVLILVNSLIPDMYDYWNKDFLENPDGIPTQDLLNNVLSSNEALDWYNLNGISYTIRGYMSLFLSAAIPMFVYFYFFRKLKSSDKKKLMPVIFIPEVVGIVLAPIGGLISNNQMFFIYELEMDAAFCSLLGFVFTIICIISNVVISYFLTYFYMKKYVKKSIVV